MFPKRYQNKDICKKIDTAAAARADSTFYKKAAAIETMRRFGTLATTLLVLLIRRTAGGGGTLPVAVLLKPQAKRCIHQVRGRIFVSQQRTRRRRLIYILYKYTAPVDLLYYCSHPPTHPPTHHRAFHSIHFNSHSSKFSPGGARRLGGHGGAVRGERR